MKSWIEQLKNEVRQKTERIEMREDVRRAELPEPQREGALGSKFFNRKRAYFALAAACVAFVALFIGVFASFGGQTEFYACVVEINPAIMLVTDEKLTVTDVKALNGDADTIIADGENAELLIGMSLSDAVVAYADLALRTGYIDADGKNNAVRVSSYGIADEAAYEIKSRLTDAFKKNGIFSVALSRSVKLEELGSLLGGEGGGKNVLEYIKSLPRLYLERNVEDDESSLANAYENNLLKGVVFADVSEKLKASVESVVLNATLIERIVDLNLQIMNSEDNPLTLFKDYWGIKLFKPDYDKNGEFGKLVGEVEQLISEYEKSFGVALKSLSQCADISSTYLSLLDTYGNLADAINKITASSFAENYRVFLKILENVFGLEPIDEDFLTRPNSLSEYSALLKTLLRAEFNERLSANEEKYSRPRTELATEVYEEYLEEIVKLYGSEENFYLQNRS